MKNMDYLLNKNCRNIIWVHNSVRTVPVPFQVIGIGCPDWMKPSMVDRQKGTDDYLFMFFPTPIQVRCQDKIRDFSGGVFFLWTPGTRHNFGHSKQPWCHFWMHATGTMVEKLVHTSSIPLNTPLALSEWTLITDEMRAIYDELNDFIEPDPMILEARLTLLLRNLDRSLHPGRNSERIPERIARVMKKMSSRPTECSGFLSDLAAEAGLSASHFSAEFRAAAGISPIRFLIDKKLEWATRMLRDRNLQISEIAEQAGFRDPLYFSRQFRVRYGTSPKKFRESSIDIPEN